MEVLIGQNKVGASLDSGSSVSLIVADLVRRTRTDVDRNYSKRLLSATGNDLKVIVRVLLPLEIGTMRENHEFTVVSELITPVILGRAFGVKNSHATSYHPQGDGLVVRSNRILLDMLRSYAIREEQWEDFLSLMLYSNNTSYHLCIETTPFYVNV
ncbi:hypothetical protein LOD99_8754 [Oopsacas minuta]|uniref:Uncharacterized protein n=1 Tax=Oopsacas minuta TaxID=111878 RepID=A0AAV7JFL5_9METZ|nr:hypothetical protein LOD99_8754 [Oopsacas minuta]